MSKVVAWLDDHLRPYGYYAWRNPSMLFGIQFGRSKP